MVWDLLQNIPSLYSLIPYGNAERRFIPDLVNLRESSNYIVSDFFCFCKNNKTSFGYFSVVFPLRFTPKRNSYSHIRHKSYPLGACWLSWC